MIESGASGVLDILCGASVSIASTIARTVIGIAQAATETVTEASGAAAAAVSASAVSDPHARYQPYIFSAYGAVCVVLGLFVAYSIVQLSRVEDRLRRLATRAAEIDARATGSQGR
jgi:heme exporter protein CcmD